MRLSPVALACLAAGCTPTPQAPAGPFAQAPGRCTDGAVAALVGRPYGEALERDARSATGAVVIRPVRPGQAVTMDYREDRLTVTLDADGKVVRLACG